MIFAQIVEAMSSYDELFVTHILYILKCLRNRLSIHPLALHHRLTTVTAENLSEVLPIGNDLEPKSNGSHLKDAIALQVFTLENLVTLLANDNLHEGLSFCQLSCGNWRIRL
jgi:hypothetical protein